MWKLKLRLDLISKFDIKKFCIKIKIFKKYYSICTLHSNLLGVYLLNITLASIFFFFKYQLSKITIHLNCIKIA